MITEATAKLNSAIDCVNEHLSHVAPNGAACYADRDEAYQGAREAAQASGTNLVSYVDQAIDAHSNRVS